MECLLRKWFGPSHQKQTERLLAEQTKEVHAINEQLHRLAERNKMLCISYEETVLQLMRVSLCRHHETGMHVRRIGLLSEMLAVAAGWSPWEAKIIRMAAPMHDVGMIVIPDAIVQKPGKLTPEEFETVKTHTLNGARMIEGSHSEVLAMAHTIALYHHERWDGRGYPHKLAGKTIPEPARIVSIVDVFDAVSHNRVYRPALPDEEIQNILKEGAGAQFDPNLVEIFMAHYDAAHSIARNNPDEVMVGLGVSNFNAPAPAEVPG